MADLINLQVDWILVHSHMDSLIPENIKQVLKRRLWRRPNLLTPQFTSVWKKPKHFLAQYDPGSWFCFFIAENIKQVRKRRLWRSQASDVTEWKKPKHFLIQVN